MIMTLLSAITALSLSMFALWFLQSLALRVGLVDIPGGRKTHLGPIPVTGGLGVFFGFTFTLLTLPISLAPYRSFIAGSAILVLVGLLDDFHELSRRSRLSGQVIAGLIMAVWGHNVLFNLGDIFAVQDLLLGYFAIPFTVFIIVATINAVNMTDGVDGLAGSLCLVQLTFTLMLALMGQQRSVALILLILIFSVLGFLMFNFPFPGRKKAHTFLGDSGSMFLGFSLAWFLIQLSQTPKHVYNPVIILWILAIPLFDIATVFFRRLTGGKSPFIGGRDHLHHLLTAYGLSRLACSLTITGMSFVLGSLGCLGYLFNLPDYTLFIAFMGLFFVYYAVVSFYWTRYSLRCC